jgi:hypothetical protein
MSKPTKRSRNIPRGKVIAFPPKPARGKTRVETLILDGRPVDFTVTDVTPEPQRLNIVVRSVCRVCAKATEDPLVEAAGRQVCSDCLVRATALAAREGREPAAKDFDALFLKLRGAEFGRQTLKAIMTTPTDERAAQAWGWIKESARQSFSDWMAIADSLAEGRELAMALAGKPKGTRYNTAFAAWAGRRPWIQALGKTDRSQLYWIHERRAEIEEWRDTLTDSQRASLNHPSTVFRQYRAAKAEPRPASERIKPEPTADLVARLDPVELGAAVVREDVVKAALTAEHILEGLAVIDAQRTRAIIAKANAALESEWAEKDAPPAMPSSPKPEPIFDAEDPSAVIAAALHRMLGEAKLRSVLQDAALLLEDAAQQADEQPGGRLN